MSTSIRKTVMVAIKSIESDRMGQLVIAAQSNEYNATGNYVMNAQQEQFLLQRVGIPSRLALKHIVALSNGTCKLQFVAQFNEGGKAWDNGKEGANRKEGIYKKDWTQFSGFTIELGFASKQMIAELAFKHALEHSQVFAAPVAAISNNGGGNQPDAPKDAPVDTANDGPKDDAPGANPTPEVPAV